MQVVRQVGEARGFGDHLVRDAGERLDLGGHRHAGIDQGGPFGGDLEALDLEHSDLRDPVGGRAGTRRLEIDDRERSLKQIHGYIFTIPQGDVWRPRRSNRR